MSKEEIPNGYVRSYKDKCVFVGIDENGKCSKEKDFVVTTGWDNMMIEGKFRDDIIVFVRLLDGDVTLKMKQLFFVACTHQGKTIPISELGTSSHITEMVEEAWKNRVEEIRYIDDLSMDLYNECKQNGIIKE